MSKVLFSYNSNWTILYDMWYKGHRYSFRWDQKIHKYSQSKTSYKKTAKLCNQKDVPEHILSQFMSLVKKDLFYSQLIDIVTNKGK